MEETYGTLYAALEEASRGGPEPLTKIGVPPDIAQVLAELAAERIRPQLVEIKGVLQLTSPQPDGVRRVKNALQAAADVPAAQTARISVYSLAAPKYVLKVEAENYKDAEAIMEKASETAIQAITKSGGEGRFKREK
jgi:translation initiation factor 2 subunit 1